MDYTTSKIYQTESGKEKIEVSIHLSDPCKNGHNDFAITGTIYELRGKRRFYVCGGPIHEEILKHFPEFKIFVDLHLHDDNGLPMYPVQNNPYTKFFVRKDGQSLIDCIVERLPELKEKAKQAIDLLCKLSGQTYEQSPFSAHLDGKKF